METITDTPDTSTTQRPAGRAGQGQGGGQGGTTYLEGNRQKPQPRRSTSTATQRLEAGIASRAGAAQRGPSLSAGFSDPVQQLQDELSSDRITNLRADAAEQFIANLEIPNRGDMWVPGYRIITDQLARETGMSSMEDDPFPDIPLEEEQPATGAVDGNIIASFVDGVTGIQKNDVLNVCLIAELAANARFARATQPVEWTNHYGTVLMNLAWVVPSLRFANLHTTAQRFTIDQVILKLVRNFLTGDEIAVLTDTMEAMKALESDDRRFTIFERNAKSQSAGNFQVDSVGTSADGTLSMKLGAYAFDTNTTVTNVLWFSFSGNSTSLKTTKSTFVLNEEVYARIRDAVVDKLGNRALDYIGGLELGD
jgi:hypothetical protein